MAEGGRIFSAQNALNTCFEHEHEDIDMYCKTCEKPICTKCVKEDHHKHDWDSLNKVAKVLRKDTRRKKMEMESVSKSIFIGMEDELNTLTISEESQHAQNQFEMESTRKAIVASVNKMFSKMQSESDKDHKSKMKSMQERKEEMKSKKERLQFLIQNMEIGAKDYTDADLIELNNEIKQLMNDFQTIARLPDSWYDRMVYKVGTNDEAKLLSMIGSTEVKESSKNAVLMREFKIGVTKTNYILALSENEAWVHSSQTKSIQLVNTSGHVKKTMDLKCLFYSFAVSGEGTVYCCNRDGKQVELHKKTRKINVLFSTAPFLPLSILLTRSGDFLITLVDEESYFRDRSSRRLLRRVSINGEIIRDYEYDEDDKAPLFCLPYSIIEHSDGRICVLSLFENKNGDKTGTVICIDSTGRVIFKYNGTDKEFNPLTICSASGGETLVSDCGYKRIHLIDSNGRFLHFILTEDTLDEYTYAIALNGSTLWVGSKETALVKVFKYTQ